MKIKTITCHDVYNHGASLQSYALVEYLKSERHEVEIIDYKPEYLSGHYKLTYIENPVYRNKPILKYAYILAKMPRKILTYSRKKKFDQFKSNYLPITSRRYLSNEELKRYLPDADIYIAGSDQIWNPLFNNGRDPAFYLDFAPENKLKISYAASIATNKIPTEYNEFIGEKLSKLDMISIRELSGCNLVKELYGIDATHVVDPVFLLSRENWAKIAKEIRLPNKYMLIQDFDYDENRMKIIKDLARQNGLDVYSLTSINLFKNTKNLFNIGPREFLYLIMNAEIVISNSFHVTAFSMIFEKEFFVFKRKDNINSRMVDMLSSFGLLNRYVELGEKSNIKEKINYNDVNKKVNDQIAISKKFLANVLSKGSKK